MPKEISTLSEFIEWTEEFPDGQYLFRGVSKYRYKIESSAYRRLNDEKDRNPIKLLKIIEEMLEKARHLGHDLKNGQRLSALELLAELQHFGAATCLIDFTRNPLFALWIACQRSSSNLQENGKVVALRSDDPVRFRTVDYQLSKADIRSFLSKIMVDIRYTNGNPNIKTIALLLSSRYSCLVGQKLSQLMNVKS